MRKYLLLIFLLLFFLKIYPQTELKTTCWDCWTNYNDSRFKNKYYKLEFKDDFIIINIDSIYNYTYKINTRKSSFKMNDEIFFIDKKKNEIKIRYYYKKMRESVNEIVTLNFKKCEN